VAVKKAHKDDKSAQYCNVSRRIWNSPLFRGLSPEAQRLFLYIITCPHGNMIGCFVLRPGYAIDDLQLQDRERFREPLGELLLKGLIDYDPETEIILDTEHFEKNPLYNPNQITAAIKKVNDLPRTFLFSRLVGILENIDKRLPKPLYEPLRKRLAERLPERYTKPVTVSVTESVTVTEGQALTENQPSEEQERQDKKQAAKKAFLSELEKIMPAVLTAYTEPRAQRQITLFLESNIIKANPRAILHSLESLLNAAKKKVAPDPGKERAWLESALWGNGTQENGGENAKWNARDDEEKAEEIKREEREALGV
jgi:hypothetical protein